MKIICGDYQVYDSGVVVCVKDKDTIFEFEGFKFIFKFLNSEGGIPKFETQLISNLELEIKFINFDKPFGIGSKDPIEIGMFNNKKLYLLYKVDSIGKDAGKTLSYTWLLKEIPKSNE